MQITIPYKGKVWTIPESRAFEVGEAVEEIVTLGEISTWGNTPRFFKLSRAVGAMLRMAGCNETDVQVHREMMDNMTAFARAAMAEGADEGEAKEAAKTLFAVSAIASLQAVLMQALPEPQPGAEEPSEKATVAL